MRRIGIILTMCVLIVFGSSKAPAEAAHHIEAVTYCETARYGGQTYTFFETGRGSEFRIKNFRVWNPRIEGRRYLVESAVKPKMTKVIDCMVRVVNGRRSIIATTRGGAEWLIIRPTVAGKHRPTMTVSTTPVIAERPTALATWPGTITINTLVRDEWQVQQAVDAWNVALPEGRKIMVNACDYDCSITVIEQDRLEFEGGEAWGLAWRQVEGSHMTDCDIELSSQATPDLMLSVTSHEIGHCLGLPHWNDGDSVMSAGSYTNLLPTTADLQWVIDTYGAVS